MLHLVHLQNSLLEAACSLCTSCAVAAAGDALVSSAALQLLIPVLLLLLLQVVATIHQPNSLITDHFDDWALLAKGRLLYSGPWSGALAYFEAAGHACPLYRNPTDFFMSLASSSSTLTALADAWAQQQVRMRKLKVQSQLCCWALHACVSGRARFASTCCMFTRTWLWLVGCEAASCLAELPLLPACASAAAPCSRCCSRAKLLSPAAS
jgi:hypothetical protein